MQAQHFSGRGGRSVVVDRVPAGANSDQATDRTIGLMCDYISTAVNDPLIQKCAEFAWRRFGEGSADPRMKAWGVFWWVKHCVRFQTDERTMIEVGLDQEQDLLINPALLVRMKNPKEDCDGFSMLAAALLKVLGVDCSLCVVAVDPRQPERWSHVFVIAHFENLNGKTESMPLDTSHGSGPRWMVPLQHISRWQCWGLDGRRRDDVKPSTVQLHGYWQPAFPAGSKTSIAMDSQAGRALRVANAPALKGIGALGICQSGEEPECYGGGATSGSSSNWTGFLQNLINQGVQLTGKILTPPSYQQTMRDPVTGQMVSTTVRNTATYPGALTAGASSLSSIPSIVWVGGAAVLAVMLLSKGRR